MADDAASDPVVAILEGRTIANYLRRGRRHQALPAAQLLADWVGAFRTWSRLRLAGAEGPHVRAADLQEEDLQAEALLRGLALPVGEVAEEMAAVRAARPIPEWHDMDAATRAEFEGLFAEAATLSRRH